jgi:uncharacterized protein (DUF1778 family)
MDRVLRGGMKTESMEIRVQPEEKTAFREAAELAGIPLSAWVRERLRRAARIELIEAHRSVPFAQGSWSKANG